MTCSINYEYSGNWEELSAGLCVCVEKTIYLVVGAPKKWEF
jgi:hypothetical protein